MSGTTSQPLASNLRMALPRQAGPRWLEWIVEARSHRVILLVLGIWLLNGFDLAFTVIAHQQGMLHEENPLARHMLKHGTPSVILFKIGLVLIGSYPLLRFRAARISELGAFTILFAYVLLAVHWAQVVDLYAVTINSGMDLKNFAATVNLGSG